MRLAEPAQPALDGRRVGEHPSVEGGVVDREAALEQHLLDVAVAERIAQVPGDGLHDQGSLEVPALEVAAGLSLQLEGKGVEDYGPAPERSSKLGMYG